jgi:hypothetical protein
VSKRPTMQSKILDALTAVITNRHLDAVHQPVYANTGTLYAQTGFKTFLEISYRFNTAYMTHIVRGPAIVAKQLKHRPAAAYLDIDTHGVKLSWHHLTYTDGDAIAAMLSQLDQLLALIPDLPETPAARADRHPDPLPDTARLAARIANDFHPRASPDSRQLLCERVNFVAGRIADEVNAKDRITQIGYLLDNGDTEADIRAHLK